MYHELTYEHIKKRRRRRIIAAVVVLVIAALVVFGLTIARTNAKEQGVVSTREAVINAAKQCCAVEGSYPSTVAHLEEQYGLVINHEDYVVSYEWFAGNVLPSVVVTAR